jgi:magnesium and cobalt exporter, CNNM family
LEEAAGHGDHLASTALKLINNLPRSLTPLSVISTAVLLALCVTTTFSTLEINAAATGVIPQLAFVLLIWLVGATIAHVVGASKAQPIVRLGAQPLAWMVSIAGPFLSVISWLEHLTRARRAGSRGHEHVTSDDIQIILSEGDEEHKLGEIAPEGRKMIAGIIEMGGRSARDIMIPRLDVIGMEAEATLDSALEIAAKYGHSRLPVYEENLDHIIGILHVKDLIEAVRHPKREVYLRDLVRPVHYVPDTAKADDLLRDLLKNRVHMAVVVDEYGGTAGVVTIEDALEEIVGEIRDEYDAAEEPEYVRVGQDEALFKARVPVGEVNNVMSIELPTEETDTLGGLIYTRLDKMPKTGDRVIVGGIELTVTGVLGRRIKQVRVRNMRPEEKEQTAADAVA